MSSMPGIAQRKHLIDLVDDRRLRVSVIDHFDQDHDCGPFASGPHAVRGEKPRYLAATVPKSSAKRSIARRVHTEAISVSMRLLRRVLVIMLCQLLAAGPFIDHREIPFRQVRRRHRQVRRRTATRALPWAPCTGPSALRV